MTRALVTMASLVLCFGAVGCEDEAGGGQSGGSGGAAAETADEPTGSGEESGEESAAEAEAADEALACKAVVEHTVNTLVEDQGANSMLQKDDIPRLVKGCENAGSVESDPETARCILDADGAEALSKCEGANGMMKAWMANA